MSQTTMIGKTFGRYQIIEKLGAGGMGEVYKARDAHLNRVVAIKVLRAELMADAGRKQRLVQEALAVSSLNHPNILVIHDFASENGIDYIVMECVAGKTLDALIPRHGMRLTDALRVAAQMADGLAAAHGAGIVHRDLKPSNVMVSDDGHVKLLDFGLAKAIETVPVSDEEPTRTRRPATEEGTIVGTAAYMSPEQAEGRRVDARCDIFSFGSVLYEMVSGRRAFSGDSRLATLSAILKEEPQALGDVPADIGTIVRRCLRKDPSRRFQHMEDVKVAIDEARESSEAGSSIAGVTRRRRVPLWTWAGLGVLCVAGFTAWWTMRPAAKSMEAFQRVPLTSDPGSEMHPTFSPDGRQVAFSWNGRERNNFDIYVKLTDGGEPLRLTTNPAEDRLPTWSPDGRLLAFSRDNAIYTISPLGGVERKIADASATCIAWTPDGKAIAFSDAPADGPAPVMLLDLDTGTVRQLTHPPATSGGDRQFAISPNGKNLAFVRRTSRVGGAELYVMPFPDGTPRRIELQNNFLYELAWTADGKDLLVVVDKGAGNTLWRVSLESGQASQVTGVDDGVSAPTLSGVSRRLAYSRTTAADENIWSLSGADMKPLIVSTLRDFNPRFSPDAGRIAFVSDRTGEWQIYLSDAFGGHVAQLTSLKNVVADGVRWSPDGRELAFAVLQAGNRDIYVMQIDGGTPRRLTSEASDEGRPSYSMDGQSIYFRSNRSGREEIWKMPRRGGDAVQVTHDGGFEALESLDGKTLYVVKGRRRTGVWSMPAAGGADQAVVGLERVTGGLWDVIDEGVCYLTPATEASPKSGSINCWQRATGKSSQKGVVEKPVWTVPPVFSASRDGRRFLWSQTDSQDADLVLVEHFR